MFVFSALLRRAATARAVLGLCEGQSYTPADIKKAFRAKALTAHPDAGGDVEHFRQLQGAYEDLLHEQGAPRNGLGSATTNDAQGSDGAGFGFYSHPHAQWANDRRSHREYWQQVHEEEINMNTNEHGSPGHASNTHYRARPHHGTYGEGLGSDFASASQAQRGKRANFSTYYFYRPYESDYRSPYGTGFTDEELQQAAREQRKGRLRTIARHACLWTGIAFVAYMHECNNRVRRATEAREKGYKDPEYWQQLREEEAEAKKRNRGPLRLENHWLDPAVIIPRKPDADESREDAEANRTGSAASVAERKQVQNTQERRRRALRPAGGALQGGTSGGTHVVSYKGRPFTPNGVRAAGKAAPVTAKTFVKDVTYDASDLDWEDEALD